jgi:hypothetical protein
MICINTKWINPSHEDIARLQITMISRPPTTLLHHSTILSRTVSHSDRILACVHIRHAYTQIPKDFPCKSLVRKESLRRPESSDESARTAEFGALHEKRAVFEATVGEIVVNEGNDVTVRWAETNHADFTLHVAMAYAAGTHTLFEISFACAAVADDEDA